MEWSNPTLSASKPVAKRTGGPPWTAIMGNKLTTRVPASSPLSSPVNHDSTGSQPAQIISDVAPSSAETTQRKMSGLGSSAKIMALQNQREWEKKQAESAGKAPPGNVSSGSSSASSMQAISPAPAGPQVSRPQSAATSKPVPKSASPVPLPSYALSHKRSGAEMNGAQESSAPKRQQVEQATTTTSGPHTPPQRQPLTEVVISGNATPVLDMAGERRYVDYQAPDGKIFSACGALIPVGYMALETEEAPFVCPVRDCRKRVDNLRALGGHFGPSHAKTAFNDNGDGTISGVAPYKGTTKYSPAVIISKTPLPLDAPPPAVPTLSISNKLRAAKTDPKLPDDDSDSAHPVLYLHGFLSEKQKTPIREDIQFLEDLPRLRHLPNEWLQHHQGEELDSCHYACALAYMVGEEVTGRDKCTQRETGRFSTTRLSDRCIRLPSGMPSSAKDQFSRWNTCVGCRYYCRLQRRMNTCDWNPKRCPASKPWMLETRRGREAEGSYDSGSSARSSVEAEAESRSTAPRQRRSKQRDVGKRTVASDTPVTHSGMLNNDMPKKPSGALDDDMPKMEDWEFAPGKILDDRSRETVAFSTSYLTSAQPITIADDISLHRLRVSPGGTENWTAQENKLRYCEVISGKVDIKSGGQSFAIGQGGVFVIRPEMACMVENRRYIEAVLSCHTVANYSFIGGDG